jgi:hypothetical protein
MSIGGRYEIIEMEQWNKEVVDPTESAYITIQGKRGNLHIISVDGQMEIKKSKDRYLFTWDGSNKCDPASGYGNFTCSGNTLTGRIYLHDGDDSSFVAVKAPQLNKSARIVNRGLLVVKAKEPFRVWVCSVSSNAECTIKEINNNSMAYLIPEFEDAQQCEDIFNRIYSDIFVKQLLFWCIDDVKWPQNRTLALFKKWFELEIHSVVEDMAEGDMRAD